MISAGALGLILAVGAAASDLFPVFLSPEAATKKKCLVHASLNGFVPGVPVKELVAKRKAVKVATMGLDVEALPLNTLPAAAVLTERFDGCVFSEAIYNVDDGKVIRMASVAFLAAGTDEIRQKIVSWSKKQWGRAPEWKAYEENNSKKDKTRYVVFRWQRGPNRNSIAFETMGSGVGITISVSAAAALGPNLQPWRELTAIDAESALVDFGLKNIVNEKK